MTQQSEQEVAIVQSHGQIVETAMANELTVSDVVTQVNKIQAILRTVMKEGTHFGIIPGCPKPSLFKPGAEKIGLVFRLVAKFEGDREPVDLGGGHREYIIRCNLYHAVSGMFCGSGVGSCSTQEAKYRFRSGPKEFTGQAVPQDYWTLRKENPGKAQQMIGGPGFAVAKNDAGVWEICIQGDRIEYDNPADYYNTVLKMAKKRAHVDAILTTTAASDIFTQDIDDEDLRDLRGDGRGGPTDKAEQRPVSQPRRQEQSGGNGNGNVQQRPQTDAEKQHELLEICQTIAAAGFALASNDFVTFDLVEASDSIGTDDLVKQICVTLSSFKGRNGPIRGKGAGSLVGTALDITLKKARAVLKQLQAISAGGN